MTSSASPLLSVLTRLTSSEHYDPSKSAIVFTSCGGGDDSAAPLSYWPSRKSLSCESVERGITNDNNGGDVSATVVSISYETLVDATLRLSQALLLKLENSRNVESEAVIAVSVPEGPYLALAVSALHHLTSVAENSAMLMPLSPREGVQRLRYVLLDAQPTFILCCKCDKDIFQTSVASTSRTDIIVLEQLLAETANTPISLFSSTATRIARNKPSHLVYTSGTTSNQPKGCVSSFVSLLSYLSAKNKFYQITSSSHILLASALPFDPCFSDVLATFLAGATLVLSPNIYNTLLHDHFQITHVLCTPSLWSTIDLATSSKERSLVVALGGEPIPPRIVHNWARRRRRKVRQNAGVEHDYESVTGGLSVRLFATYGVTEACVYQTAGEVFWNVDDNRLSSHGGQDVGTPLDGNLVRICKELNPDDNKLDSRVLQDATCSDDDDVAIGEVILFGTQVDEFSGYWNRPELNREKFLTDDQRYCFRTGDRGYIHPRTGHLYILGRIQGEEGMIKHNGVRVELSEIESAIVDQPSEECSVVTGCVVTAKTVNNEKKQLTAFCVLSKQCWTEMSDITFQNDMAGFVCTPGPLLVLLRARCADRVRLGCTPSAFVLIEKIPLTSTGKLNRNGLPSMESCIVLPSDGLLAMPLWEYGGAGAAVAAELVTCLNLCQKAVVTTEVSFAMLGGDSLAATRVTRALYAMHHGVANTRMLGGAFGGLSGPFDVSHLLKARHLKDFVDMLDANGVCQLTENITASSLLAKKPEDTNDEWSQNDVLYDALLVATTMGQTTLALALLAQGADPNYKNHGKRLGKISGRVAQREAFRSNPLHLACARGNAVLVEALLRRNCNCKSPDASGLFPIHLACLGMAGTNHQNDCARLQEEDRQRLECVCLLLEIGEVPLTMKDGSKQTVLHSAARSGFCNLLDYLMKLWKEADTTTLKAATSRWWGSKLDWQDRWYRTPVHWAVLNGKVGALRVLLKHGCNPNPPKPRVSVGIRSTSVAIEAPMDICKRLYGTNALGKEIQSLLLS